jgi:hypothetical protein
MLANPPPEQRSPATSPRWISWLISGPIFLIWFLGSQDAIQGGLNPGYMPKDIPHPYPLLSIFVVWGIITTEAAILYAILRPSSFSSHPRRVLPALVAFVPLWVADYVFNSAATDLPGYYYSNGFFLLLTVFFLGMVAATVIVLAVRARRGPEAGDHRASSAPESSSPSDG